MAKLYVAVEFDGDAEINLADVALSVNLRICGEQVAVRETNTYAALSVLSDDEEDLQQKPVRRASSRP